MKIPDSLVGFPYIVVLSTELFLIYSCTLAHQVHWIVHHPSNSNDPFHFINMLIRFKSSPSLNLSTVSGFIFTSCIRHVFACSL